MGLANLYHRDKHATVLNRNINVWLVVFSCVSRVGSSGQGVPV